MKEELTIRAVDYGGNGLRRADVVTKTGALRNYLSRGPVHSVEEVIEFVTADLPDDSAGVAYAMAGVHDNGVVINSPNIPMLNGFALQQKTEDVSGKACGLYNDMQAATTGMAALLPDENTFMSFTWSSGVGGRLWSNGRILSQAEPGHIVLDSSPSASVCACGKQGHAEAMVGGEAIRKRIINWSSKVLVSLSPDTAWESLHEAYGRGDQWALDLYRSIAKDMGLFLAIMQSAFRVPCFVFKGTVAITMLPVLEARIRQAMKRHLIDESWADPEHLRFRMSPDPQNDGLIGAALCFRQGRLLT